MPDALHVVRIPLRSDRLARVAQHRGIRLRDLDEGYLCHCVLRELWQQWAPSPFVLRGRGRTLDAWGYSPGDATVLREHASTYGDPVLLTAISELADIASRPVPLLQPGRRVGFTVRACPVVRLSVAAHGHRAGAEIDAFLAACFTAGAGVQVSREEVYRNWASARINLVDRSGVRLEGIGISAMSRERLVRRTHAADRPAARLERPDVRFHGSVVVVDGERFRSWLAHGLGRHRAFGFGAVMMVPPGSVSD